MRIVFSFLKSMKKINLSKLSWSAFRGDKIFVFHTRSRVVSDSHGGGSFKEPIHKQFYSKRVVKFQANGS